MILAIITLLFQFGAPHAKPTIMPMAKPTTVPMIQAPILPTPSAVPTPVK